MILVDPHSDVAQNVLGFTHNSDRERIVYLSTAINREAHTSEEYTAIFNPFETLDKSAEMQNLLAQELTECISELLAETSHSLTIQMTAVLRPCIATTIRSNDPSLATLARMLLDGQNEDLIALGRTSPIQVHREFFEHSFSLPYYALTKKSIHTKLLYFLGEPTLANMLNGSSTISIEKVLEEGKVLIISVPKGAGKFSSSVISRLAIAHIHALMLRRAGLDRKQRKKCFLFLDEFQTMLTGSLASSLAETRKYGLSLILSTQTLKALEGMTLRKTVMVNTGLKMVGLTDYEDRTTFAKEFDVPAETFSKLKPLHFVIKKNDGRHKAFTFRVPILAKRYFLTKEEKKKLLNWLVYDSGMYIKIAPPLAPPPVHTAPIIKKKAAKKTTNKDNPFDDNLQPAF